MSDFELREMSFVMKSSGVNGPPVYTFLFLQNCSSSTYITQHLSVI